MTWVIELYHIFLEFPVLRKVVVISVNLHHGDAEKTGQGNGSKNWPGTRSRDHIHTRTLKLLREGLRRWYLRG
jgi:hypothetical protein